MMIELIPIFSYYGFKIIYFTEYTIDALII